MSQLIETPVSPGELIDKITILRIKADEMVDPAKRENVLRELALLDKVRANSIPKTDEMVRLEARLEAVNRTLWKIEDDIRDCERAKQFDEAFIALARSVYQENDKRAALKKEINLALGSLIVEEKSYAEY